MRIPGDFSKIMGVYNQDKKISKVSNTSATGNKKDTMIISNEAKDYQLALKAVYHTPDLRQEKIEKLEKTYANGTYTVTGVDVADKMVQKLIDKKV